VSQFFSLLERDIPPDYPVASHPKVSSDFIGRLWRVSAKLKKDLQKRRFSIWAEFDSVEEESIPLVTVHAACNKL
jgi:hypothetical protein